MKTDKFDLMVAVSRHELGHWFLAKEFGFDEDYIRILFQYGNDGKIYPNAYAKSFPIADLPSIDSIYTYLTRRIMCLQSGVIAEFIDAKTGDIDIPAVEKAIDSTASNDYKQINELVYIARGIRFAGDISKDHESAQIQEVLDECWYKALEIVNSNITQIVKMSNEMADELITSRNGIKFEFAQLKSLMSNT